MRSVIFLSGSIQEDQPVLDLVRTAGLLVCADGGIRHMRRMGCLPDLMIGDMDSVTEDDLAWISSHKVPIRRFPAIKDETDAELSIRAALDQLPEAPGTHEIILAGALGSRPDHVLATQLLAARLASPDRQFILTDGRSSLYTLTGGQTLMLDLPAYSESPLAVSAIPVSDVVSGLTYEGLQYPLVNVTFKLGSTRGVSNHVEKPPVIIKLDEGVLFIVVTPEE